MRTRTRTTLAVAVAVVTVVGFSPVADADKNPPLPSQSEVDSAEAAVARRAGDVAAIRAELALAQERLQAAAAKAEIAAEAYNGARWQLEQAKEKAAQAAAAAVAASKDVEDQRAEIAALAVQSFQDGSELTELMAYLSPGGPQEVADRITITQSIGATLQDRYDAFAAADILAKNARAEADAAKRDQEALTAKAEAARDQAAATAHSAQAAARSIAVERRQLIAELAKAEKISVALATRRQQGLEKIAQQKAAQAAAEKAAAEAAAEAAAAAAAAAQQADDDNAVDEDDGDPAPVDPPPVSSSAAASRALAFARAQLGEPYLWAAAGPNAWDCSGLTMMAWNAGGVSLPHYSAAQYDQTRRIGVNDLRPGDLVFWGDSPASIHHVALYLGNGQIIHAPRTGRPVAIDSMYYWVPPNYFGRP